MSTDRYWDSAKSVKEHLLRGGGLGGEIADLRKDLANAFGHVQSDVDGVALSNSAKFEDRFVASASQVAFTLTAAPVGATPANLVDFYVEGLRYGSENFTVLGALLTWSNTPFTFTGGENITVVYQAIPV